MRTRTSSGSSAPERSTSNGVRTTRSDVENADRRWLTRDGGAGTCPHLDSRVLRCSTTDGGSRSTDGILQGDGRAETWGEPPRFGCDGSPPPPSPPSASAALAEMVETWPEAPPPSSSMVSHRLELRLKRSDEPPPFVEEGAGSSGSPSPPPPWSAVDSAVDAAGESLAEDPLPPPDCSGSSMSFDGSWSVVVEDAVVPILV